MGPSTLQFVSCDGKVGFMYRIPNLVSKKTHQGCWGNISLSYCVVQSAFHRYLKAGWHRRDSQPRPCHSDNRLEIIKKYINLYLYNDNVISFCYYVFILFITILLYFSFLYIINMYYLSLHLFPLCSCIFLHDIWIREQFAYGDSPDVAATLLGWARSKLSKSRLKKGEM